MIRSVFLLVLAITPENVLAQETAFTYQGRLEEEGVPANGDYAFVIRLFDEPEGGHQRGPTLCDDGVGITHGLFTLALDFGQQFNTGEHRFVDIQVLPDGSCDDTSGFAQLLPRQQITATPFALAAHHAKTASALDAPDGSPVDAVFVDNNGNVGIGTTAPTSKLDVIGPMVIVNGGDQADALWLGIERSWVFRQQGTGAGTALKLQSVGGGGNKNFIIETAGNVGIGTTTPQARLDVRGDIRLGPSGQFRATAGEENLRIVRGFVNEHGVRITGSGFTTVRNSTGNYTIQFTVPFAAPPIMTCTAELIPTAAPGYVVTDGVGASSAVVKIFFPLDVGIAFIDNAFSFIAIGPR